MADLYNPEQFLEDMLKIRGGAPAAQLPSSETPITLPQDKTSVPLAGLLGEDIDRPSLPVEPQTPELGPVQQAFKDVWVGFKQGMYGEADALDMIANVGAKATGLPKGEFFRNMMGKVFTEPGAEDIKPGLGHMVLRGIGAAVPIIAEFVVGTKGVGVAMRAAKLPTAVKLGETAATQGARWLGPQAAALARQRGVKGAIGLATPAYFGAREAGLEAARGIVEEQPALPTIGKSLLRGAGGVALGGGLEALHPLKAALAVPAGAGMFGTQAAVEQMVAGQPPLSQETLSSLLVGGALVGGPRLLAKPKVAPGERPINYVKVLDKNSQEIDISQEHIDALRHHLSKSRGFDPADLQSKPYSELQTILESQTYPTIPTEPGVAGMPARPTYPFEEFMGQIPKYEAKSITNAEKERASAAQEKQAETKKQAAGQLLGKEYWDGKFKEGSAYLVHLVARGKGGGFKNHDGRYVPSTEQFEMAANRIGIGKEDMPKRLEFFTYLSEVAKGTEGKDRNIKKFLLQPAEKKVEAPLVPNATDPDLIKSLEKSEVKITQKPDGTLDVKPTEDAALGQHELIALMRKLDAEDSYLEPSNFETPREARAYLDGTLSESDMNARVEARKRGGVVPEVQAPIEERPTAIPQPRAEYKIGDRISYINEQGVKFEGTVKDTEDSGVWVQWGGAKGTKFERLVPWELLEKQVEKIAPPTPAKEVLAPKKPTPVSEEQALLDQVWEQTKSFVQEREKEVLAGGKIGKERIVSKKEPTAPTEKEIIKGTKLSPEEATKLLDEYDKNMKGWRTLSYKKKTKKTPEAQKRAANKMAALGIRNQAINDQLNAYLGMTGTEALRMDQVRERLGKPAPREAVQTYRGKPDFGRPSVLKEYKPVLDETDIPTRIEDLEYSRKSIMDGILQLPKDSAEYKGLLLEYEAEGRELAELRAGRIPKEQSPYPDTLRAFEEEAADTQEVQIKQAEALRKAQIETTIPEKGKRATVQIRAEEERPAKAEPITWEEALKAAGGDEDVARSMISDIEVSKEIKTLKSEMRQVDFRIVGELGGVEAYMNYEKNIWAGIDLNTGNWEVKNKNGAVINHGTDTASLFKYLGIREPVRPQPLPKEHIALIRTHYGPGNLPYTQRTLQAAEQAAERLRRKGNDAYVKQIGKDEFVIEEYGGITTEIRGQAALEKIIGKSVERGKEEPKPMVEIAKEREGAPKEAKMVPMYYKVPIEGVRSDLRTQYPKGTSTLTMIKDGVRTATTRSQPLGKVGDLIKFDNSGDIYRISNVERLPKDIDWSTWSQKEGWDPSYIQKNLSNQVKPGAYQTTFEKIETPTSSTLTVDKEIIKSPEDIENFIKPEPKVKPPAHDADAIIKDALAGFQSHLGDLKKVGDNLSLAKDRYLKLGQQSRAAHESLQRDPNNLKIKAAVEDVDKQLAAMAPELQGLTRLMMDMERTAIGGAPKEGYRNEGFYDITDETGRRHQGAIISNGYEGGATYFLMQGPEGGIPDANKPGNRIAGTAYLVDAKHEGRAALKLEAWDAQEGTHPEVQDRLLNTILTKNLEGTKPKEVVHKQGVADDVWERRKDQGWENAYNAKVRRAMELGAIREQAGKGESLTENLRQAMALKEKAVGEEEVTKIQTIIDGVKRMMDKEAEDAKITGKQWTDKQRVEYSRAALELNDSVDHYLMDIDYSTAGAKPTKADIVPWLDRYADPSKSSNPTMRRLANYGMQFEMAYRNTLMHYMRLLDTRLGWLKNNPEKSRELMQHLHEMKDETGKPFVSKDPAVLQAIADHRMIMDDLAHRFELEKKGLYVKKYATLQWDMEKIWQHFKKPFEITSEYTNLPDNVRAGFEPQHWSELKRIVEQYKDKPWEKIHPDDRTYFINNYLRWSGVFPEWQYLPEDLQQIIPEKKWSPFFQKRTPMGAFLKEVALNEDYFDVTNRYLNIAIKGAITNEFLSRANPLLRTLKFKETKGSWGHMAQEYVRRLAGYGNEGIMDTKWKAMANSFNKWLADKKIDHGIPMYLPKEFADWYRESLYRGALGPDTAVRNLTQSIYTWADQGTMPLLKGIVNATRAWATKSPEWTKFRESMDLVEENYWNEMANLRRSDPGLYGKIKHINQRITHWALSPLRLTENINKSIAYFATLEKGIADGVDFRTQHLIGLRAASNVVPNFELSEGQWRAWQGMGAGQFFYGKANTSPYMTGTGMSLLTPFWSFPLKSAQFLRNGIKESWISGDKARLTRFLALTGFMVGAPTLLATTLGVDAYAIWGKGALPIDIMPMWYNTMREIYVSAGGGDSDDAMTKQLAGNRMKQSLLMMVIPGYRWLKKTGLPYEIGLTDTKGSYQRLQDKYVRWGRTESPMANTNEFKELLTMFGFPPMDRREGREYIKEGRSIAQKATYDKSKVMRRLLDLRAEGNNQAFFNALKMAKAQGIDITSTDISMAQSRRDVDAYTLQAQKMPKKVRGEWMAKAEEMKRKYLKKGKRSMWVSQETKEPEEVSEE